MNKISKKIICSVTYLPNNEFWLKDEFESLGMNVELVYTNHDNKNASLTVFNMFKSNLTSVFLGIKTYRRYSDEDVVIFWTYLAGLIFSILDLIKPKTKAKTKIIALHMLVIRPNFLKKLFIQLICLVASKNNKLIVTVNSEIERISFSKAYLIDLNIIEVLPDCISSLIFQEYKKGNGSIFCGGDNSRDWGTFLKTARMLPNIDFIGIARKRNFKLFEEVPENCKMYFDTDINFFKKKLEECEIVAMPLSSNFASGLIVLGQSASMCKPVIVSETSCTVNYVEDMKTGILLKEYGNPEELSKKIQFLLENDTLKEEYARAFSQNMRTNHSQNEYVKKIVSILKCRQFEMN